MNAYIGFSVSTLRFPILGWLIMAMQKWRYSHSFVMVFVPEFKHWYIIDATAYGVRVREMETFLTENKIVKKYAVKSDDSKSKLMLQWGLHKSGLKYPKIEVFGNLIQLLFYKISKKVIKNPFGQGPDKPRCNELVAQFVEQFTGLKIPMDLDSIDLL